MSHNKPSDTFTRFTSTSPHAFSSHTTRSSSSPTTFSSSRPIPSSFNAPDASGETPAQKVARLRAAARAAKERNLLSRTDRIINRGRIWADRAHRIVTYSLIGFTGIAAVVSVYSLTSLITHNRRQKRAWIDRELDRLRDAQTSFLQGTATADQLHLLEQERAGEEIAEKAARKKKEGGIWKSFKTLLSAGGAMGEETVKESEDRSGRERLLEEGWVEGQIQSQGTSQRTDIPEGYVSAAVQASGIKGVGIDEKGRPVPAGKIIRAVEAERRTGERELTARTGITGGPLDVMAENIAEKVSSDNKGWMSWIRGGGKS